MVGSATTPMLFQSKLLCLSVLYLLTTLPLSIYVYLSQSGCIFSYHAADLRRSRRPDLFPYPPSYGEHKYALPFSRSSCTSPVPFPDYQTAVAEIRDSCRRNSSSSTPPADLRYMSGNNGSSFAGNFSSQRRRSFFVHDDDDVEVPCGFLTEFPVTDYDRKAMEQCHGVVVASAVFGDHDKIRQPKGVGGSTLGDVCFFMFVDDSTLRALRAHGIPVGDVGGRPSTIGAWRLAALETRRLPYADAAMNGVVPKHLAHRLFPNARYSVWVDAKLQLAVDPLLLVHSLVISQGVDMAVSKHPFNVHTMEEAMATARWRKWKDVDSLRVQMETYCELGLQPWSPNKLPYPSDVPDTALIIRRHGKASNLFSCLLFNELEAFNPRDQLAFAYVRDLISPGIKINMFDSQVFEHVAVEFRHNIKREEAAAPPPNAAGAVRRRMASWRDVQGSSCESYLSKMWGE